MPTFDDGLSVNGTVTIFEKGDGAVLLSLANDRHWEFRQVGADEDAALEIASVGGGGNKNLIVSTTGHVGIGVTNPKFSLDVQGGLGLSIEGDGNVILSLGTERSWQFRQLRSGQNTALELASVGGGGNKDFIINTAGRVGIGTTTPEATLDVVGSIQVSEDLILSNADCAEEFDVENSDECCPGTVLVAVQERLLAPCNRAYDPSVVGVVSGSCELRPGIVLGRKSTESGQSRVPVALAGSVFCNVDATEAPIRAGDLLTTSPRVGYAMLASDRVAAFGAVMGKALQSMAAGTGCIPILVTLQ